MGNKKNRAESTPPPAPETEQVATDEIPASQIKDELLERRALFAAYDAADAEATQKKNEFELAQYHRSQAVKAIYNSTTPPSKGPFRFKGNIVTIVARTTKGDGPDAPETVTYFFKGQRQGVLDVD